MCTPLLSTKGTPQPLAGTFNNIVIKPQLLIDFIIDFPDGRLKSVQELQGLFLPVTRRKSHIQSKLVKVYHGEEGIADMSSHKKPHGYKHQGNGKTCSNVPPFNQPIQEMLINPVAQPYNKTFKIFPNPPVFCLQALPA